MSDPEDEKRSQEEIHDALQKVLKFEDGEVLTGWIVAYEKLGLDNVQIAGHIYGPSNMTTWGAIGLIEWAKTETIPSDKN